MKGFPKHIATGEDLYNCLALVQAGEVPAAAMAETMVAIEQQQYISVPILSMSEDRKTVVIYACPDAAEGVEVQNTATTTIKKATVEAAANVAEAVTLDAGKSGTAAAKGVMATMQLSGEEAEEDSVEDAAPMEEPALAELTLSRALAKDAATLKITAAQSPFERLGMTEDDFNSIKGVLKNYE